MSGARRRIGLVHALHASMAPVEAAFRELWPEAETVSLYDQSLYVDYDRLRELTPELRRRVAALLEHSAGTGAEAILFTGSLFGEPVEAARERMAVPVLTAYEALIEEALAAGRRLALLATVPDTITMMRADIERHARAAGAALEVEARLVAGALEALMRGDREAHDAAVADAARALADRDAVMLGQFSMAPARARLDPALAARVLSSPGAAVRKLRRLLGGG